MTEKKNALAKKAFMSQGDNVGDFPATEIFDIGDVVAASYDDDDDDAKYYYY